MIKAEKKTLKLSVEKPLYITVNDILTHRWIPGSDLQAGSETGYNLPGNKRWKNLSLHPLDLWRRMADDG